MEDNWLVKSSLSLNINCFRFLIVLGILMSLTIETYELPQSLDMSVSQTSVSQTLGVNKKDNNYNPYGVVRPIALVYVYSIGDSSTPQMVAAGLGVPTFAPPSQYNYFVLAFWNSYGPINAAQVWVNPVLYMGTKSQFGKNNQQIRQTLLGYYHRANCRLLVTTFGSSQFPTTIGKNPIQVARDLATFVIQTSLDGLDFDWEDNQAMEAGTGQQWLIDFHRELRRLLPNKIICHSPQAPYFKEQYYRNGAYMTIHRQIGNTIDFYNVQFYNQIQTRYDTKKEMFYSATGPFSQTSFSQIVRRGIPINMIVIGKPGTRQDAANTGFVPVKDLVQWVRQIRAETGWNIGYMVWQYLHDRDGAFINPLMEAITQPIDLNLQHKYALARKLPNLIAFSYIYKLKAISPPEALAASLGVPRFAQPTIYNYFALTSWNSFGPTDTAIIWSNPSKFFGTSSQFGSTNEDIRANLIEKYHQGGIYLLVSVFGNSQLPASSNREPLLVANDLASFVLSTNLDGVDINWLDNDAMEAGTAEDWLITFQLQLRRLIPDHIISHSPQAPFFKQQFYVNGGYMKVHRQVGHSIDFYNIQFYNQGDTAYNTKKQLFGKASGTFSGTSLGQIIMRGVPGSMIVLGKPASIKDVANTGYVPSNVLAHWVEQVKNKLAWKTGFMTWQYVHDSQGLFISKVVQALQKD